MTCTCPIDSAMVVVYRLMCTDESLLRARAAANQLPFAQRGVMSVLLDVHWFVANMFTWDAVRLVVMQHALYEITAREIFTNNCLVDGADVLDLENFD